MASAARFYFWQKPCVITNAILLHLQWQYYYNWLTMPEIRAAIDVLRANGYKVTQPRRQVLKALSQTQRPVSPYDIQDMLRLKGEHLNHVTIYRILDLLCTLNLAHKVLLLGGFVRCNLGGEESCHRFMVCRECGALEEFADRALCMEESDVTRGLGFRTEHHFSEVSGVCAKCQV